MEAVLSQSMTHNPPPVHNDDDQGEPAPPAFRVVTDPRDPVNVPTQVVFQQEEAVLRARVLSRRWGRAYVLDAAGNSVGEARNGWWSDAPAYLRGDRP